MYENERIAKDLWEVQEVGSVYTFEIKELRSVKVTNLDGQMKKLWFIALARISHQPFGRFAHLYPHLSS